MAVEQRVSTLERLVGQVAEQQIKTEKSLDRLSESLDRLSEEMIVFKDDIREDTRVFKEETRRDTMVLKQEMATFKDEVAASRKEMDKKWGDLANKMGTLVEDIIAPNLRGVVRKYFGPQKLGFAIRVGRHLRSEPGTEREFDAIVHTDTHFFLAEAKAAPTHDHAERFVAVLPQIPDYFPEARGKQLIPIFSSLQIPDDTVTYLTRRGVYCMVMGEDNMVLANFDEVQAREHT